MNRRLADFIFGDHDEFDRFDATDGVVGAPRTAPIYLTGMANVLRAAGLTVIETDGWQTRARGSGGYIAPAPLCVMWHHTASNPSSDGAGDVDYIINSQDGPLSNLYIQRNGTVWVIAAGATNTNGKGYALSFSRGTVHNDQMNTNAVGIEAANNGVGEVWPQVQVDAFFKCSNAINAVLGNKPTDLATHAEWAPDRKIDPAVAGKVAGQWQPRSINNNGTWNADDIRSEAVRRATNVVPPKEGKLVFTILSVNGDAFGGMMDDKGIVAQITWLNPGRYNACMSMGSPVVELSPSDLINCDLLGPMPPQFNRGQFANVIP